MTAILIVTVVSASAVYLIDSGYTVLRKTQQRIENEQFLQLANAVENFGIDIIYRDNFFDNFIQEDDPSEFDSPSLFDEEKNPLGYDPFNDSLFEPWSESHTPGFIKNELKNDFVAQDVLYITDMNRFFNINNLHFANSAEPNVKRAFENNVIIFKELIRQINDDNFDVDPDEIANEIIDWLDHDDDSRSVILFTEDDVYRRADSSFRPANRPIASIGELENVLGMTPQLLNKLSDYVVALPVYMANFAPYKQAFSPYQQGVQGFVGPNAPVLTKININTCPPELLEGIFAIYNIQSAVGFVQQEQGKFERNSSNSDAKEFIRTYVNSVPFNPDLDTAQIEQSIMEVADVYSQFFLIESFFQKTNGISFNLESLVYKDKERYDMRPIVVQRQYDWLPSKELKNTKEDESS